MGNPKQPAALLEAKGAHISKEELKRRYEEELKVDLTNVNPPDYLPQSLIDGKYGFWDYASKLLHIGVFTELDEELLARYLLENQEYLKLASDMRREMAKKKPDYDAIARLSRSKNAAFKRCQECASGLGLSITSRCRLAVPRVETTKKENIFEKFVK